MTITIDSASAKETLGQGVMDLLKNAANGRVVIAVAGVPGSGKSTVGLQVCNYLQGKGIESIVVGMDGFHLTRDQLRQMPDPDHAFKRRGAPFTFDATGFVSLMKELRQSCVGDKNTILVPSFDHQIKDPTPNDIKISPSVQVVIVEGLYTLLNVDPWCEVNSLVDQTWFVKVDQAVAKERLAKRHLAAGIESTLEHAYARVDQNDSLNGDLILDNLVPDIDIIIE